MKLLLKYKSSKYSFFIINISKNKTYNYLNNNNNTKILNKICNNYYTIKDNKIKTNTYIQSFNKKNFGMFNKKKNKNEDEFSIFLEKSTPERIIFNKELSKVKNINSLVYFIDDFSLNIFKDEYFIINIISKFRELEQKEDNSDIKVYVILDQIFRKNTVYSYQCLLCIISLMYSQRVFYFQYWDYIVGKLTEINILNFEILDISDNDLSIKKIVIDNKFVDIMKGFAIIPYNNEKLWKLFEKLVTIQLKRDNLTKREVENIILCFINKKQGSEELMKKLIEHSKENSDEGDIIINYTISIIQNYRNYDIYHKFICYCIDYISDKILKLEETKPNLHSVSNIDLIYSLLPGFHNLLRIEKSYKHTDRYDKDDLSTFIISLEKVLSKFLELEIHKFEEQDYEQMSKILRYLLDKKTRFKHISTKLIIKFFNENHKNILKIIKNKHLNSINKSNYLNNNKSNVFSFENDYKYKYVHNFLAYFKKKQVPKKYIESVFLSSEDLSEILIENVHLMTFDDLYEMCEYLIFYNVINVRLWVFVQNTLISELKINNYCSIIKKFNEELENNNTTHENTEELESKLIKINKVKDLFYDNDFYMTNKIFLHFIYFLNYELENIEIKYSWIRKNNYFNNNINIQNSKII